MGFKPPYRPLSDEEFEELVSTAEGRQFFKDWLKESRALRAQIEAGHQLLSVIGPLAFLSLLIATYLIMTGF